MLGQEPLQKTPRFYMQPHQLYPTMKGASCMYEREGGKRKTEPLCPKEVLLRIQQLTIWFPLLHFPGSLS